MKDKLRELAERWSAIDPVCEAGVITIITITMNQCAAELMAILDAEGDGGAVDELFQGTKDALTALSIQPKDKQA